MGKLILRLVDNRVYFETDFLKVLYLGMNKFGKILYFSTSTFVGKSDGGIRNSVYIKCFWDSIRSVYDK